MKLNRKTLWSGASDKVLFCFDLCGVVFNERTWDWQCINGSFSQTSVPYLSYLLGTLCVCFLSNLVLLVWQSNELGIVFLFYRRRNWGKIYYLKVSSVCSKTGDFHCFEICFVIWDETINILFLNKKVLFMCLFDWMSRGYRYLKKPEEGIRQTP